MTRMIHSAKFWTAIVALVINIGTYVVTTYYPAQMELAKIFIGGLDTIFGIVIAAWCAEDLAAKKAAPPAPKE